MAKPNMPSRVSLLYKLLATRCQPMVSSAVETEIPTDIRRVDARNVGDRTRVCVSHKPADASKLLSEQRGNAPLLQAETQRFLHYFGYIRAFEVRFRRVSGGIAKFFLDELCWLGLLFPTRIIK